MILKIIGPKEKKVKVTLEIQLISLIGFKAKVNLEKFLCHTMLSHLLWWLFWRKTIWPEISLTLRVSNILMIWLLDHASNKDQQMHLKLLTTPSSSCGSCHSTVSLPNSLKTTIMKFCRKPPKFSISTAGRKSQEFFLCFSTTWRKMLFVKIKWQKWTLLTWSQNFKIVTGSIKTFQKV